MGHGAAEGGPLSPGDSWILGGIVFIQRFTL